MGLRSKLRREAVFTALETKLAAEAMDRSNVLVATIVGSASLPPATRKKLLQQLQEDSRAANRIRLGDVRGARRGQYLNSELALLQVYETLEAHGLIGDDPNAND
jgi:hypothetical protein